MSEFPVPSQESSEFAKGQPEPSPALNKLGFNVVEGMDVVHFPSEHRDQPGEITKIDNREERFGRLQRYIDSIAQVAATPEQRKDAVGKLLTLQKELQNKNFADVAEIMDYVKRVIAHFNSEAELKLVLQYGARDVTQDLFAREGYGLEVYLRDQGLTAAATAAIELAQEKYAQEHGGRAYQTKEQQAQLAEAKERAGRIKVS